MHERLIEQLRGAQQRNGSFLDNSEIERKRWPVKYGGITDYESSFRHLLPDRSLEALLEQYPTNDALVLDLMGYGEILRELQVPHGLAVALSDVRSELTKKNEHIDFISGDVTKRSTYDRIEEWLSTQPDSTGRLFHVILCRPMDGMQFIPKDPKILYALTQRAWSLLTPNHGTFLSELPQGEIIQQWLTTIQADKTLGCKTAIDVNGDHSLMLQKFPESPERLPY